MIQPVRCWLRGHCPALRSATHGPWGPRFRSVRAGRCLNARRYRERPATVFRIALPRGHAWRFAAKNWVPTRVQVMAGTLLRVVLATGQSTAEDKDLGLIMATESIQVAGAVSCLQGEGFDRQCRKARTPAAEKRSGEWTSLRRGSGRFMSESASLDSNRGSRVGHRENRSPCGKGSWIRRSPPN